jgi:hypothetical protein
MIRDILQTLGIAAALIGIVSFFAAVSPNSRSLSTIESMDFEVNQTSALLENLIMTHNESVNAYMISYGECATN